MPSMTITADDVATFGPTLRLLLLEEAERQHGIANALEKKSEPSAAATYARVLTNFQLSERGFQPDKDNRAFFPAVGNLILAEAKRLQDLLQAVATTLPNTETTKALLRFEKYRRFLVEVGMACWSVD